MYNDLTGVLEGLIKATVEINNSEVIEARKLAIETLGYDPTIVDHEFLVTLEIGVVAQDPESAVRQFIGLIEETTKDWVYTVKDMDNDEKETIVDSYRWER